MEKPPAKIDTEILTIGDELNRGEIIDTNSSWLAERLTALGAHVRWRTSVTDDPADMRGALSSAAARSQVTVVSGGLGPTEDDRTVDVVAALTGVVAAREPEHEERMRARFAERNFTLTENNLRQVRIPAGATVLQNRKGLAPGFSVRIGRCSLYFMPGVPRELKPMFENEVTPHLRAQLGQASHMLRRTWRVAGMGESHVDAALQGLLGEVASATLHFRIAFPETLVTVILRSDDFGAGEALLARVDADVRRRLGAHLYGTDEDSLAAAVGRRLRERGETLAVAESCTGGLVGQLLTAVPGSSAYFRGGVIAYDNRVKEQQLGVRAETLQAHGAVSAECAREMAEGVRARFGTTYGVAITGIAGPDGGTAEKPVGLVFIHVAGPSSDARQLNWKAEREQVRQVAAHAMLHLLFKKLSSE